MEGRVALVTGASSGIGRATALALGRAGAAVALVALGGDDLDAAVADVRATGARALGAGADVGDPAAVAAAFDVAAAELGAVDAVHSNAGVSHFGPVAETTDAQWQRLVRTNVTGGFNVVREAARRMAPRGRGALVLTASELALMGQGGYVGYTATKGAALAMARALAGELAPVGIRVNAVCPGPIDTPLLMGDFAQSADAAAEREANERSVALGRLGEAEEIADAVVFLLSDAARFVTGTQLAVDGGRTGCFPT